MEFTFGSRYLTGTDERFSNEFVIIKSFTFVISVTSYWNEFHKLPVL